MSNSPHRKRVKHLEGLGHLHELTFSCYRRKPLLTNDSWRGILARAIDKACEDEGFGLVAFVFMPEHVHLLVVPRDRETSRVSRFLARFKQPTSKQIKAILVENKSKLVEQLTVQERPGNDVSASDRKGRASIETSSVRTSCRHQWTTFIGTRSHDGSVREPTNGNGQVPVSP